MTWNFGQNLNRMNWRTGKTDKLLCSKDGEVRSTETFVIKNGMKIKLRRPIYKNCPFEASMDKGDVILKFTKDEDPKMIKAAGGVY